MLVQAAVAADPADISCSPGSYHHPLRPAPTAQYRWESSGSSGTASGGSSGTASQPPLLTSQCVINYE